MNLSNFGQTPYVSQYIGLPLDGLMQSATALTQRYEQNRSRMDQLDLLASNLKTLQADAGVRNAQVDAVRKVQQELAASGNYEQVGSHIRQLAREFTLNPALKAAQENYARYQTLSEDARKRSQAQQFKLLDTLKNYKGVGTADELGNFTQFGAGLSFYDNRDVHKELNDLMKDWKTTKETRVSTRGGYDYKIGKEWVPEEDLHRAAAAHLSNDPALVQQMIDEVRYQHGDSTLSGDGLKQSLSKHMESYIKPYVDKYGGVRSYEEDRKLNELTKMNLEHAHDRSMEATRHAHAKELVDYKDRLDKEVTPGLLFPGGVFNAQAMLPKSVGELSTRMQDTDHSLTTLKTELGKATSNEQKAVIARRLHAAEQQKQLLAGIRAEFYATKMPPAEAKIVEGMMGVKNRLGRQMTNGEMAQALQERGIAVTPEKVGKLRDKQAVVAKGFDAYLEEKAKNWSVKAAMMPLDVPEASRRLFSEQMQAMGDYKIYDENGNNVDLAGRKFDIYGISKGNIAGMGYQYGAVLEPTEEEKKSGQTAKRVTIVPSMDDKNYLAFARQRLAKNPRDPTALSMLNDEFAADVAGIAHLPYDARGIDVTRPYTAKSGELRNVHLAHISKQSVTPESDVFHYRLKFGGKTKTYSTEAEVKDALSQIYSQWIQSH